MDTPEPSPREAEQRAYAREVAQGILTKHHRAKQAVEERQRRRHAERAKGSLFAPIDGILGLSIFAIVSLIGFGAVQMAQDIGEQRNVIERNADELDRLADEAANDADDETLNLEPTSPSVFDSVQDRQREEIAEFFAPVVDKAPDVAIVFAGALTGYGATHVVRRRLRSRRTSRAAASEAIADVRLRWQTAVVRHDEIAEQYAALRLDPVAAIDHMALWDVRDELTERFTLAYAKVTDARARHQGQPADPALVDAYADLVDRARLAWVNAREHARQVGVEVLPADQQDSARTARSLLVLANSDSATEEESRNAAEKASKRLAEIRGIRFPAEASKAILAPARKAITA